MIAFGGIESAGISRKLWEWNGLAWRLLDSAGPSSLAAAAVSSGGALSFITLQSGRSDDRVETLTWKWAGGAWARAEIGPPITSLQPSAAAPDGTVFIYQTQDWLAAPVLHVRSPAGVWRSISLPAQPAPRIGAACAYDPARKRLVLYGAAQTAVRSYLPTRGNLIDNNGPRNEPGLPGPELRSCARPELE